jgi:hypothetical protein
MLFLFVICNSKVDPIDEPIPTKTTHRGWTDGVDDARPPGNVSLTFEKDFHHELEIYRFCPDRCCRLHLCRRFCSGR